MRNRKRKKNKRVHQDQKEFAPTQKFFGVTMRSWAGFTPTPNVSRYGARLRKGERGFTLIELLTVISVIGMIASIVLASINTARANARDARRKADLNQITKALDIYYDQYGVYPCGDANSPGGGGRTVDSSGSLPFLDGTGGFALANCVGNPKTGLFTAQIILRELTGDPLNQSIYYYWYEAANNRQYYVLSAVLENDPTAAANDGGQCLNAYEVGTGAGRFEPYIVPWYVCN